MAPRDQVTDAAVAGLSVVVIGATSGIGAATARRLVAAGADVVFAGRREAEGEALAAELGPRATFRRADLTVEADVEALVGTALELHGKLDGLVNCAGESIRGWPIEETDIAEFERLVATLAGGAMSATKHAARAMLPREAGSIVHIGSVAAVEGGWSGLAYSAGKAAIKQVVRCAAVELGERGVRVNLVSPGPIMTGMFAKAAGMDAGEADRTPPPEDAFREGVKAWQPMKLIGVPDHVATAAVWLLGDGAALVNGADVPVDGGSRRGARLRSGSRRGPRWPPPTKPDSPTHRLIQTDPRK